MNDRVVRPRVTSFGGEWEQLARMMQQSWAGNKQESLRYTEGFLRSTFTYPGCSLDLAKAVYSGNELAAFVAGFPRNIHYCGRSVPLVLNSFLTASLAVRGAGVGLALWRALAERARTLGYEGTINFCVDGDNMNAAMPVLAGLFQLNTAMVYKIEYLTRFVRPSPKVPKPLSSADVEMFCQLAAAIPDSVPFARTWTYAEANWQCRLRDGVIAVALREDDHHGILTGYAAETGEPPKRVAIMEDLLWGNLDAAHCVTLLRQFLDMAGWLGCQSVSCPMLGYASTQPLVTVGFRRSKRILNAYLTLWNGQDPVSLSSIYLDVF